MRVAVLRVFKCDLRLLFVYFVITFGFLQIVSFEYLYRHSIEFI